MLSTHEKKRLKSYMETEQMCLWSEPSFKLLAESYVGDVLINARILKSHYDDSLLYCKEDDKCHGILQIHVADPLN